MEELNYENKSASSLKDTLVGLGGILTYIAVALCGLVLLVMFFKGTPWIAENVYPWALGATAVAMFVAVPISLVLTIFKKSRGVGGGGLFLSSYFVGLTLWVLSLMVAYSLAGIFWMVVGLVFGGIGVVPVAIIASLLWAEWSVAAQIIIIAIVTYTLRVVGLHLADRA